MTRRLAVLGTLLVAWLGLAGLGSAVGTPADAVRIFSERRKEIEEIRST